MEIEATFDIVLRMGWGHGQSAMDYTIVQGSGLDSGVHCYGPLQARRRPSASLKSILDKMVTGAPSLAAATDCEVYSDG